MAINPLSPSAVQDALFQAIDQNKDGKLTGGEIKTAVTELTGNKSPTADDVAALTRQLDTDGDSAIDIAEFEKANVSAADSTQLTNAQNLLRALQQAGIGAGAGTGNTYTDLIQGSLNGTFNATGALVGSIVGGSITNKVV
jgi:hypothetical protein